MFKAWISGDGSSPDVSLIHSQTPYILTCQLGPTGGVIANDWADLTSGNIAIPILYTEKGCLSVITLEVWTNTNYQGTQDSPIGDCWTGDGSWRTNSSSYYGQVGSAYETDQAWTDIGSTGRSCNQLKYLYCFEQ